MTPPYEKAKNNYLETSRYNILQTLQIKYQQKIEET